MLLHTSNKKQRLSPEVGSQLPHSSWRGQCSQVQQILGRSTLQPKLKIGAPNDRFEQEADRVADQVMRMPDPQSSTSVSDLSSETAAVKNPARLWALCRRV